MSLKNVPKRRRRALLAALASLTVIATMGLLVKAPLAQGANLSAVVGVIDAPAVAPQPLTKNWCGRLWGVVNAGSIVWDDPVTGLSSTAPVPNHAEIPPLPTGATPPGKSSPPGYAALGIHARTGSLYVLDRGSSKLYQYNISTGVGWTATQLLIPVLKDNYTNFNKMTVVGDTLLISNNQTDILYSYSLDPSTGQLANADSAGLILDFDTNTPLPDGTTGVPIYVTHGIGGGDIAQDEFGVTYMVNYDANSGPYAYLYRLSGTRWIYKDRVLKSVNTDQFAGLAFYNDAIYLKGTAGTLFKMALNRLGDEYDWAGNAGALTVVGQGTGTSDMAACGFAAVEVTKTQKVFTDQAGTLLAADQTRFTEGQYIKYTISVTNTGDTWVRGSYLRDELPAGISYVANSATENGANFDSSTYPFANRPISSNGAAVGEIRLSSTGNGNVATYTYMVKVEDARSIIINKAKVGFLSPNPSQTPNCAIGLNCGQAAMLEKDTNVDSIFIRTMTDANGEFEFLDLGPGEYTLIEDQPAGYRSGPELASNTRTLNLSASGSTDTHFGETGGSFAGRVVEDNDNTSTVTDVDTGIANVTIRVRGTDALGMAVDKSTTTAADGSWEIDGILAGSYKITEVQPGFPFRDGPDFAGTAGGTPGRIGEDIIAVEFPGGINATGYIFMDTRFAATKTIY